MLHKIPVLILFFSLSLLITGCGGEADQPLTPTLSAENVIRTAEAIADETRQATRRMPTPTRQTVTPTLLPETSTPEPSPTLSFLLATADYNAYVRVGPGEEYEYVDFFLQGQQAEVIGRYDQSPIGTWWYLRRIEGGLDGWVWSGAVTIAGDPAGVPVYTPPATPTETEKPSSEPSPTVEPTAEVEPSATPEPEG